MSILLSHTTALETLRRWDLRKRLAKGERCDVAVPATPGDLDVALGAGSFLGSLARPIDLLVSDRQAARAVPEVAAHLQSGPLPAGSAIPLADGILCSGPEQIAVQMAPRLTQIELAYLLSELMGTYAICPAMEDGMFQRDVPLTTPERVLEHLGRLGRRPGVRQVRSALEKACVMSGSPRETKLTMRLALKPALGGYHLNVLSMNEPLEVRRICDRMSAGTRRPDILIASPGGDMVTAMEYLGDKHDGHVRLVQDANRTNELKAIGISEYQVRKEQYADLDYMDGLVERIRNELGYPRIGMTRATAAARKKLRGDLCRELDAIDGVTWNGRERAARRAEAEQQEGEVREEVPLEAYGLD